MLYPQPQEPVFFEALVTTAQQRPGIDSRELALETVTSDGEIYL
jgi:hypothetical protein